MGQEVTVAGVPESLERFLGTKDFAKPQAIQKIRYSHDAMIDMIVGNPWISQGELAMNFGYTEGWVSQVIASDAFQARLAQRKEELIDPYIKASIEERFKGLIIQSLDKLRQKLEMPAASIPADTLLRTMEIGAKALGYGAKVQGPTQNVQFVVNVPPKALNSETWAADHAPNPSPRPALDVASLESLLPVATAHAEEAPTEVVEGALDASGQPG